jgi:uncharacterized protein YbjT (DUF2867 family)
MSIVITTPTWNIGGRALQQLLKAGADVSVIVRQPEKLSDSIRCGRAFLWKIIFWILSRSRM